MNTEIDFDGDQTTAWLEDSNGGAGPDPIFSIERNQLEGLERAVENSIRAEQQVAAAVLNARSVGASWATIGSILGTSRQGSHKKYANLSI